MSAVLWFRRDLRLTDNPALIAAADSARAAGSRADVVPLFVIDPLLWDGSGEPRRRYLAASLRALDDALGGRLVVRTGDPAAVVPTLAREVGAQEVHVAADFGPYGRRRDAAVEAGLDPGRLVRTGSPYAVAPGRLVKPDGTAYRVFSAFHRAWLAHGWRSPAGDPPPGVVWLDLPSEPIPTVGSADGPALPAAGELVATERWEQFLNRRDAYASDRDRPDLDATSRMSVHLRFGEIHPRTLLAALGPDDERLRAELCWREFYADVLAHRPESARESLDARFDTEMAWDDGPEADARFAAWATGRTGFPLVDAGMRQLRTTGWMHNRVRMVVASFLVKDLHLPWQRGAAEFMRRLVDGDLASNAHGWQWTAGCGTDAAPFHRVFNPVRQGLTFDPDGEYVRRYVPELRHLAGAAAHEPWLAANGYARGYPERIVDHAAERLAALDGMTALRRPRPTT